MAEHITVTLTAQQQEFLLDLLDTTDYDESYFNEIGWALPEGLIRETYKAIAGGEL